MPCSWAPDHHCCKQGRKEEGRTFSFSDRGSSSEHHSKQQQVDLFTGSFLILYTDRQDWAEHHWEVLGDIPRQAVLLRQELPGMPLHGVLHLPDWGLPVETFRWPSLPYLAYYTNLHTGMPPPRGLAWCALVLTCVGHLQTAPYPTEPIITWDISWNF